MVWFDEAKKSPKEKGKKIFVEIENKSQKFFVLNLFIVVEQGYKKDTWQFAIIVFQIIWL